MQNKKMFVLGMIFCGVFIFGGAGAATFIEEEVEEIDIEQVSADAVSAYDPDGSLFQQITSLEQEKVLMQLEKERAQLDLELDRLAAEKIKLHMEIDTLSGRAEQQQQEIETQKARLERAKLAYVDGAFSLDDYKEKAKQIEDTIEMLQDKINTADKCDTFTYSAKDILVARDIAFINKEIHYFYCFILNVVS